MPPTSNPRPGAYPPTVAIVGGGPAGLRAAECAAHAGAEVHLFDAKPSVGRKFLVAGKSGLNLTNTEAPAARFLARYSGPDLPATDLARWFAAFDNTALRAWATDLGVPTFDSAGGKVFPESMKAAPLLRRWVSHLRSVGVTFHMNHRLAGIAADPARTLTFNTPGGTHTVHPGAAVLALGGGSWPGTGSDGTWTTLLADAGVAVSPLAPANAGWETAWPPALLDDAEGQPLKNITASFAGQSSAGELVVTRYGLEGAPLYRLGPLLRDAAEPSLTIDLKPALTTGEVEARLANVHRNFAREARRRLKLSPAAAALLKHLPRDAPYRSPADVAATVKTCRIPLTKPRPLAEAISSAGGVAWSGVDRNLMLRGLPGVFAAGEMLDWEAPTGGYLIQAAFTTGTRAGEAAAAWVLQND